MRIDKSIKELPWPQELKSKKFDALITLHWPVVRGEKLLVVTFTANSGKYIWRRGKDFRIVCSKEHNTAALLYKGSRVAQRQLPQYALREICFYPNSDIPKISKEDKAALLEWLDMKDNTDTKSIVPKLCEWVQRAMESETQKERDARGEIRDEDVLLCPEELPDGLIAYIEQNVLPQDDVLIYKRGNVRGTCYLCRREVRARSERFTQGKRVKCPNCGQEVSALLGTSDRFRVDYVEDIVTLQKGTDGKTVFLRQWHLIRDPSAQWEDIPAFLEEICRYAIRGDRVAKWQLEAKTNWYGSAQRYKLNNWTKFESVTAVYDDRYYFYLPQNWRQIISETSLQYCPVDEYVAHMKNGYLTRRNTIRFLLDWVRYPAIEKFWKAGYKGVVSERIWGLNKETQHTIRWSKDSIKSALRFPARFLKIHEPQDWTMHDFAKVAGLWKRVESGELPERDLPEMAESMATLADIKDAIGHASIHKILKYVGERVKQERECRRIEAEKAKREGKCYWGGKPFDTPHTYRDYLADCVKLNLDLDDRAVLFPQDLNAAHARTIAQVKHKANELSREAFLREVERLSWMEWQKNGLMIRLPVDGDELTAEGAYLHHCVGGYVDRMANGKTTILLVRRVDEPDKPFYTLEWLNGKVQQCRTTHNEDYVQNEEVKAFIDEWVKRITKKPKKKKANKAA